MGCNKVYIKLSTMNLLVHPNILAVHIIFKWWSHKIGTATFQYQYKVNSLLTLSCTVSSSFLVRLFCWSIRNVIRWPCNIFMERTENIWFKTWFIRRKEMYLTFRIIISYLRISSWEFNYPKPFSIIGGKGGCTFFSYDLKMHHNIRFSAELLYCYWEELKHAV